MSNRDRRLPAELQSHLQMAIRDRMDRGESAAEAEAHARREMGNQGLIEEATRDQWSWTWLEQVANDVRYGLRAMRRNPGFTAAVVLSLALGIGANTAVFSLLNTVLLRTLPVDDSQHLFFLDAVGSKGPNGAPPYPCFERFREQTRSFSGMSAFTAEDEKLVVDGQMEKVHSLYASANYFDVLGVRPALGRLLHSADERLQPPTAVISYGYWQRRFGGDPAVLGKTIHTANQNVTIVGVSMSGFAGLDPHTNEV
jgi:hypothetical protein